ncbi:LCP family protein [Goekera deserti]|uniref:LCP family protein n=1 Tax=Goekera deserti TaxID=2497753 RepID=A0A7K3WF77_9ACTN|nr:LCP family protein [Goekera deserti]NDI48564.1 hypothetical protein [Goekera deserti]NEL55057.1 LCP family protein [Goekera deserti]
MRSLGIAVAGLLVVALGVLIGGATLSTQRLDGNVSRVESAFPTRDRPAPAARGSLTFLLVGVEPVAGEDRPLVDAVSLVHVGSDLTQAQVVAVPVDTWVTGEGTTLSASFRDGGPASLVGAVETLSGVLVDHYAEVDFEGFAAVVDDLGGIEVDVPQPYANRGFDFPGGRQRLDGAGALAYVRDASPEAGATTAARQQAVLSAVFDRVTQLGVFSDVGTLTGTLEALTRSVSVDDSLSGPDLVDLAWSMRDVGPPAQLSVPISGTGTEAGGAVQYVDVERAPLLWRYLRDDVLADHLDEFR